MYTKKQLIISVLLTALVFSCLGGFISKNKYSVKNEEDIFQAGLDAAYQRLISAGYANVVARGYGYKASNSIGGGVVDIYPTKIILEVNPLNPLADPSLGKRNVIINDQTKIYRQVEKSFEMQERDMREFEEKLQEAQENGDETFPEMPDVFTKKEIGVSELTTGDSIIVTAVDDVHDQAEFVALEIVLAF